MRVAPLAFLMRKRKNVALTLPPAGSSGQRGHTRPDAPQRLPPRPETPEGSPDSPVDSVGRRRSPCPIFTRRDQAQSHLSARAGANEPFRARVARPRKATCKLRFSSSCAQHARPGASQKADPAVPALPAHRNDAWRLAEDVAGTPYRGSTLQTPHYEALCMFSASLSAPLESAAPSFRLQVRVSRPLWVGWLHPGPPRPPPPLLV